MASVPCITRLERSVLNANKWGTPFSLSTLGLRSNQITYSPSGDAFMNKNPDAVAFSIKMDLDPGLASAQAVSLACGAAQVVDIGRRYVGVKDNARSGYFVGVQVHCPMDEFDPKDAAESTFLDAAGLGALMQSADWVAGKYCVKMHVRVGIRAPKHGVSDGVSDLWLDLATDKDLRAFTQNDRFSLFVAREPADPTSLDLAGDAEVAASMGGSSGGASQDAVEAALKTGEARVSMAGGGEVLSLCAPSLAFLAEVGGIEAKSFRGYQSARNGCTVNFYPHLLLGGMEGRMWVDAFDRFADADADAEGPAKKAKLEGGGFGGGFGGGGGGFNGGAVSNHAVTLEIALGVQGAANPGCDNVAENLYSLFSNSVTAIANAPGALFHEEGTDDAVVKRGEQFAKIRPKSVQQFLLLDPDETVGYKFETSAGVAAPAVDADSGASGYCNALPRFKPTTEHDAGAPPDSVKAIVKLEITRKSRTFELTADGPVQRNLYGPDGDGCFNVDVVGVVVSYRAFCRMQLKGKKASFADIFPKLCAEQLYYRRKEGGGALPIGDASTDRPTSFAFASA
jgi:hypothetical protein